MDSPEAALLIQTIVLLFVPIEQMKENCFIRRTTIVAQLSLPLGHYHYKAFEAQTV